MPTIDIPAISIPEIKINVPQYNPYQVLNVPPPSIKLPGCVKYHRDASPKNTALYDDDPTGTTISCPYGSMPTFEPLLYNRRKIQIVENKEQEKRVENLETPMKEEVKLFPTHTQMEKGFFCMVIKSHFGMKITTEKSYPSICVVGEL